MYVYGIGVNNKHTFRWMHGKLDISFKTNIENDSLLCSGRAFVDTKSAYIFQMQKNNWI